MTVVFRFAEVVPSDNGDGSPVSPTQSSSRRPAQTSIAVEAGYLQSLTQIGNRELVGGTK